jgi:D-methionine transport system ATP-binding protein
LIQIQALTKIFKTPQSEVRALDAVDLAVKPGEIYGVIGFSGAGKSTLVRCINLLERPTSGSVHVDGQELTGLEEPALRQARQKIGMIFQHFSLLSSRNSLQNVMFPLEITHTPRLEAETRATELLRLVGLSDKLKAFPHQLSGGQKQRVAIARALANSPKLLLSDEATSALDPQTSRSIMDLLAYINRELHLTVVLITHDMNVVKQVCDRVSVMEQGRIVETGEVLEVFSHPRTEAARNLINAVINRDIPADLLNLTSNESSRLVRISFIGDSAGEPLISALVKQFDVMANILYANVDRVKDVPFGSLTLELLGEPAAIRAAIQFLQERGLTTEVLEAV